MAPSSSKISSITRPDESLFTYYLVVSLLTGPLFPLVFLPCYFKYKTLQYEFDEDGVSMSWGVLWKQEISVSYSRIQDIHMSRGLVERWMGLATIQVQTASGSAAAELSIVGLPNFEEVRDYLYSKMRGARFGDEEETAGTGETVEETDAPDETREAADDLLVDIRFELRQLRKTLEKKQ